MHSELIEIWDYLNTNFSQISVLVLAWTAIEAWKARKAVEESNELSQLPLLTIHFKKNNVSVGGEVVLRNNRTGNAFDIKIEPCFWFIVENNITYKIIFKVPNSNFFTKDNEIKLDLTFYQNGQKLTENSWSDFFVSSMRDNKFKPYIFFRNIRNTKYVTSVEINNENRVKILRPPVKFDLTQHFLFFARSTKTYFQVLLFYIKRLIRV